MSAFLDKQHEYPVGIVGRVIGERMVRQHAPETAWSISQLALTPTDRVLEIGFGAGRAIELVVNQTPRGHVTGIDVSATMVRAAQRRNVWAIQSGRVALLQGNLALLPFADQQFDKIFSIHTLYFWPEPSRVLKPNGLLVLTLSTGRVNSTGKRDFGPLQTVLEERIVPEMRRMGFTNAYLQHGPDSRQFTSVAVIGKK
jgi:ubiquinone/menaquinone biosynthesis C-methylase UbiE